MVFPIKNILGVIVEAPDGDRNSSAHRDLVPSSGDLNSGVNQLINSVCGGMEMV